MPIGKGQTLGIGASGQTETYATLAQIRDVGGPNGKVDSIDSTHSTSTSRRKLPGFLDNGQVTAALVYTPAQTTVLRGYYGVMKAFEWTLSDGSKYNFEGFFVSMGKASPYEGLITQDVTIEVDGDVTYTEPG